MSDFFSGVVKMMATGISDQLVNDIASTQSLHEDTLSALIYSLQKDGMKKKIFDEYPGIVEAQDSFESKELRDAITLIAEGDFQQVSAGVNTFNSAQNDGLMKAMGLPVLSEQDKFTLAMLRGKV